MEMTSSELLNDLGLQLSMLAQQHELPEPTLDQLVQGLLSAALNASKTAPGLSQVTTTDTATKTLCVLVLPVFGAKEDVRIECIVVDKTTSQAERPFAPEMPDKPKEMTTLKELQVGGSEV